MMGNVIRGGCLCRSLRFASEARPLDTGYCHCRLCQLSTGAPALVWATFPLATFAYEKGDPTIYRSSSHGQREFCGVCGTQIAYRVTEGATTVDVNVGCLDAPEEFPPKCHTWNAKRIAWFETADDLPRFEGDGPDSETPAK